MYWHSGKAKMGVSNAFSMYRMRSVEKLAFTAGLSINPWYPGYENANVSPASGDPYLIRVVILLTLIAVDQNAHGSNSPLMTAAVGTGAQ